MSGAKCRAYGRAARKEAMERLQRENAASLTQRKAANLRAARAEIVAQRATDQAHYAERQLAAAGLAVACANRLTGLVMNTCAALDVPTKLIRVPEYARADGRFQLELLPRFSLRDLSAMDPNARIKTDRETMRLLKLDVVRERIDSMVHVHVDLGGDKAGYAISESALAHMPDEDLEDLLAREIARVLVRSVRDYHRHKRFSGAFGGRERGFNFGY